VGKATNGHAMPAQACIQRVDSVEDECKTAFREHRFKSTYLLGDDNEVLGLFQRKDAQTHGLVGRALFERKESVEGVAGREASEARKGAGRISNDATVAQMLSRLFREHDAFLSGTNPFVDMEVSHLLSQRFVFGSNHKFPARVERHLASTGKRPAQARANPDFKASGFDGSSHGLKFNRF